MIFPSKSIKTADHWMVGTIWPYRGCEVEMCREGFQCTCKVKPRTKCKHITWVEMNILGVNAVEFEI